MTYDERQLRAVLVVWLCCRREFYSTHPEFGCVACRRYW